VLANERDERFVSVIDVASGAERGRANLDVPARHALWANELVGLRAIALMGAALRLTPGHAMR
jgi:hypothetical protein